MPVEPPAEADWVVSLLRIQQLVARYALAVDSRDLDTLVSLFVPDVMVGRGGQGREALRNWYAKALRSVGATIHLVANHTVDIEGNAAQGILYCREEVEHPDSGEWRIGMLQYWDDYELVDGAWLFLRRRVQRWYSVDALDRPQRGTRDGGGWTPEGALPESFATWGEFQRTSSPKVAKNVGSSHTIE